MATDWEEQFRQWAKAPGKSEEERCENARSAVRNAIKSSDKLKAHNTEVFLQGSYANNTNVRTDSDVDVGVVCYDSFLSDLPKDTTREQFGIKPASYPYEEFRRDVKEALLSYFGKGAIIDGNKAIDLHETSYHVEADVAPFFEHRRYFLDGSYIKGVELPTQKDNARVINWPRQHYDNGVQKNKVTDRRFKALVRVLKALSNKMSDAGYKDADVPGFLIECLVWNVPNNHFKHATYTEDVRAALAFLYHNTQSDEACWDWGEVSELKYLFRGGQKWQRADAVRFVVSAWGYLGLSR